jgi:hypothetical protein
MASKDLSPADIITVAAAVAGIGVAVVTGYQGAVKWFRRTIGSRRDLANRLNQLAAGVTTRYVEELFGAAAFDSKFIQPDINTMRQLVYRTKHAGLLILADDDGVTRFSITATDPRFKFQVRDLTLGHMSVRLGKSHFADVKLRYGPVGRSYSRSAAFVDYAETYWFGRPGGFQHYVLSTYPGIGDFGSLPVGFPDGALDGVLRSGDPNRLAELGVGGFDTAAPYFKRFRAATTVSTLTVLRAGSPESLLCGSLGADVTFLIPRKRRQVLRRLRRANRKAERVNARNTKKLAERQSVTDDSTPTAPEQP